MAKTASATIELRLTHGINVKSDRLTVTTESSLLSERHKCKVMYKVVVVVGFLFVRRVGAGDRVLDSHVPMMERRQV